MAEIDDVRRQIEEAADRGDQAAVVSLSERYRDLQVQSGQAPLVGRLRAETGREFQLSRRALQLRQAGREDEARQLIRVIARERYARQTTRGGRGRGEAFVFGADRGLLNIPSLVSRGVEQIEDWMGNNNGLTARERSEDLARAGDIIRQRHPVSAGAGEVTGVLATIPAAGAGARVITQGARTVAPRLTQQTVRLLGATPQATSIGARARAADLAARGGRAGQIVRGTVRAGASGAAFGAAQGGTDADLRNEDVGEGIERGAQTGAAFGVALRGVGEVVGPRVARALANAGDTAVVRGVGRMFGIQTSDIIPVLRARYGRAPTSAEITQERLARQAMRRYADSSDEAAEEIVRRYSDFRQANRGVNPSAIEIIGQRSGRGLGRSLSGHGEAVERAAELSEDVMRRRPGDVSDAISAGRPRTAAGDVNAQTSRDFTALMDEVGPQRVNLADEDLTFLGSRTARAAMKLEDGVLSDAGQRIDDAIMQRQRAAATAQNVVEAQQKAADAFRRAEQSPTPANRRALENAVSGLRAARARAKEAAEAVRPVHLTIREIETLRHDISNKARDGNTFALNDLADQIRDLAVRRGGRVGARYERGVRDFAAGRARAEGIEAGRAVARNPTDEARAVARGDVTSQGRNVPASVRPNVRGGAEEGASAGLAERAAGSFDEMAAVSDDLADNRNLRGALEETLGVNEADRLQRVGQVNRDASERMRMNAPNRGEALSEEAKRAQRLLISAGAVAQGSTGGAFRVNLAERLIAHFDMSREQALELADLAFNPDRVGEFVSLLARAAGSAERLRSTMDTLLGGILPAGVVRNQGQQEEVQAEGEAGVEEPVIDEEQPNEAQPVTFNDVDEDYLNRLAMIESSGNANARARTSSAAGLYQFTEGTWLDSLRRHGQELGLSPRIMQALDDPSKREGLLRLRHDPEISSQVVAALTAANFNALAEELGRDPTSAELYAAHFLGLGGALRLLQAIESGVENAAEEFPREARANRTIFYDQGRPRSAQEVLDELASKWN